MRQELNEIKNTISHCCRVKRNNERTVIMYRSYENTCKLESLLKQAELDYAKAVAQNADEDILIALSENISDLRERINFAWQDDDEQRKDCDI